MAGIHDGHRQRLRERFLKSGLDGFEPHNVLELLLFYALPQRDTNELAHQLLDEFGSLSAVLEADVQELCRVKGVGQNVAALLTMMPPLARYYMDDCNRKVKTLETTTDVIDFISPKFIGRTKEMVFLLCTDNKASVVFADFVAEGSVNATLVNVREILAAAMRHDAVAAIVAHNHPKGLAIPSKEDLLTTKKVYDALASTNIRLVDHLIFASGDCCSMRESGYFTGFDDR